MVLPDLTAFESVGIYLDKEWLEALLIEFPNISTHQHILPHFLVSDLKQSADPQTFLPPDILEKHNVTISGPFVLQIYRVEDIGLSALSQIYKIEDSKHGQQIREAINEEEQQDLGFEEQIDNNELVGKKHTCKLILEDGAGRRCFGFELKPIDGICVGMRLGQKVYTLATENFRPSRLW
ncbi:RecQ-mediated genome instability protein 1 [Neolecta irregularis DAH-3]|uniref:RecQ-mediated genome instability protein 1 n=1 Tax=Neolecta irregularis (strain DAH-3) TaxID=1198029 RepID=A0A1U7LGV8_NEOID|nr:RecQ-mediated genome instability protein 1 [Neolecta irregularis DAH-3]|eukprot:OLL21879.1 RecQ-mediated genome instability protein 1 [Neolecta irregularis DAH-3]